MLVNQAFFLALAFSLASISISEAAHVKRATCSDGTTVSNDACCSWITIRDDLQDNLFVNECDDEVHETLRLAFHDAMGLTSSGGGGADGSILTFNATELTYEVNGGVGGITDAVDALQPFVEKYTNVTTGDLLQFAAAVGLSNCAGAPTLSFYAGRAPPTEASPDNTIPVQTDDVDTILSRFSDVGISSDELIALMAAHSIAGADFDTALDEAPIDSTPGTFDSQVYIEILLNGTMWPGTVNQSGEVESPLTGELRIESDYLLARDSRTACAWQSYIDDQDSMRTDFAVAMLKLSLIGQDQSSLTDCSDIIPSAASNTREPYYPSTLTQSDIQQACTETAFPALTQSTSVTSATPVID